MIPLIALQMRYLMVYTMGNLICGSKQMDNIYKALVEHFGTQEAAAQALSVDQSAVSGWVRGVHGMSPSTAVRAERATGGKFRRQELCPSFPWEETAA